MTVLLLSVESPAAASGAAARVAESDVEASEERRALDSSAKPERARQQTSLWWQRSAGALRNTPAIVGRY